MLEIPESLTIAGQMNETMLSKKTVGKPCLYCGNVIQKANYMGGTVYFCPACQRIRYSSQKEFPEK